MRNLRQLLPAAGIALAALLTAVPAQADPPPWAPAHGHRAKQYRYVYYPAHEVYYAPETRLWFWLDGGRWRTGAGLPAAFALGGTSGVTVVLDTRRPYDRHVHVVERYGHRHHDRDDRHDRHDHRHDGHERHDRDGHRHRGG
jgi:hypothetical protein